MPINEAAGFKRRSNLTKEQKADAERAIYGLPALKEMQQLTPQEIERMRAILQQHDAQNPGANRPKEFDLNNPPKEPYRHQEFPKVVYDHAGRTHKVVHSKAEEEYALADGFVNEPFPAEVPETELSAEDREEADRLEKIARKKRSKE